MIGLPSAARSVGVVKAADLFCGAGGTSTALIEAVEAFGLKCRLTGINHWPVAIATHSTNHPEVTHYCEDLHSFNPRKYFNERELDVLWASPSCTNHSNARGAKPRDLDQSRADPWCVIRWLHSTLPSFLFVENIPEFTDWGPLDRHGRPIQSRKGEIFHAWVSAIRSARYRSDWRILCAADYGDPTTRRRFFLQAVTGRRRIVWPNATHAQDPAAELFGANLRPWVPARDIIDWSLRGQSIFERKRPLRPKTLARIQAGLKKFGLRTFIVQPAHGDKPGNNDYRASSVESPLGTMPCSNRFALAQLFLIKFRGTNDAASVDEPAPTVTSGGQHLALCEPYVIHVAHKGGERSRPISQPLPTVCGNRGELALVEPFLLSRFGSDSPDRSHSVDSPIPTVTASGAGYLIEPFLVSYYGTGNPAPIDALTRTKPSTTLAKTGCTMG